MTVQTQSRPLGKWTQRRTSIDGASLDVSGEKIRATAQSLNFLQSLTVSLCNSLGFAPPLMLPMQHTGKPPIFSALTCGLRGLTRLSSTHHVLSLSTVKVFQDLQSAFFLCIL